MLWGNELTNVVDAVIHGSVVANLLKQPLQLLARGSVAGGMRILGVPVHTPVSTPPSQSLTVSVCFQGLRPFHLARKRCLLPESLC